MDKKKKEARIMSRRKKKSDVELDSSMDDMP